ncbi:MAG: response regulator transcription factor [Bacteroidales bacterium]|nr:response regulator transcription factor [Bacteroidales bacterium]
MKALIVEDETMARKALSDTIANNYPDIVVTGETSSVKGTVEWLHNNSADIIFMDVELSDGRCFEIFRQIEVKAMVIMTTAYDNYAVQAFEVGGIDYLLKPIEPAALERAVERCRQKTVNFDMKKLVSVLTGEPVIRKERFLIPVNNRLIPVKTAEVAYFYSEEKNNYVVTLDGNAYVIDSSLDSISETADDSLFFRISRRCIISKSSIESITKLIGGRMMISVSCKTPKYWNFTPDFTVSRSRTIDFIEWMQQ